MDIKIGGLAWAQSSKLPSTSFGTFPYMAPELLSGDVYVASRTDQADIFSLGVLLFILKSGKMPFAKADKDNQMFRLLFEND